MSQAPCTVRSKPFAEAVSPSIFHRWHLASVAELPTLTHVNACTDGIRLDEGTTRLSFVLDMTYVCRAKSVSSMFFTTTQLSELVSRILRTIRSLNAASEIFGLETM